MENGAWQTNTELFSTSDVLSMRSFNNTLYVMYNYFANGYDTNNNEVLNIWTYGDIGPRPSDLTVDEQNTIWLADLASGLVKRIGDFSYEIMHPNGPATADIYDMIVSNSGSCREENHPGGVISGFREVSQISVAAHGKH